MATYVLRPASDDKAQWTEVPAGAAWSVLNEAVTEANVPDTSNNYVETTTDAQINRQFFESFQIPQSEVVTRLEGWWYCQSGTTVGVGISLTMQGVAGFTYSTGTVASNTPYAWVSRSIDAGGLTGGGQRVPGFGQADINALELGATQQGTVTSGASRIAAEFIRVYTVSAWNPHRMPLGA